MTESTATVILATLDAKAILDVLPSVSKPNGSKGELLESVHIEHDRVVATDGYTLLISRAENTLDTSVAELNIFFPKEAVKLLKEAAKKNRSVSLEGDVLIFMGSRAFVKIVTSEYPRYRQVLPTKVSDDERVGVFNIDRLSVFAHIGDVKLIPVGISTLTNPILFVVGKNSRVQGLLMGVSSEYDKKPNDYEIDFSFSS